MTVKGLVLETRPLAPERPVWGLMGGLQRSARALRAEVETHFETGRNHDRKDRIQGFLDTEFLIVPRVQRCARVERSPDP